jgi:CubicO group peptidase (beta-lactamase class C family)
MHVLRIPVLKRAAGWCAWMNWFVAGTVLAAPAYDFGQVERTATQAVEQHTVPSLAIALAKDGKIVYEHAFGYADVEAKTPATTRTAYPLASATKPITATALMVLQEQRRLDISAPVGRYVPALQFRDVAGQEQSVTLLQLLSHTSGLGTYARIHYGDAIPGPPLDAEFQRYGTLFHPPGRVAEYSNLGYGVIGRVIERQSKQSLSAFVDRAVFRPLGMRDSFIDTPEGRQVSMAAAYDAASARLPALYNNTPGAGNAYASVHDLMRFGMFHVAPDQAAHRVLSQASVERMQINADPAAFHHYYGAAYYGLGWYVRPNDGGHRVVWHEGGMPGASTIIKLIPEQGIVAVVLTNRTDANELTQTLADQLIRVVLPGFQPAPLNPVAGYVAYTGQPEFLGRWVGKITADGITRPCTLVLGADGNGVIRYSDGTAREVESGLRAMVNGDSFVSGFPGRLPARDVAAGGAPLLLLKLVRTGNELAGTIVAYSSPQRLDYLLPFAIVLERESVK